MGVSGLPAGMVLGEVETYCRLRPVSATPLASTAVAVIACWLFWFTTTGLPFPPGALRVMETGGQVEKNPAELAALAKLAEMSTDPGWFAVATPLGSIVTTLLLELPEPTVGRYG